MEIKSTVTVIGGGVSGLFTALDLALRGIDVTLVDRGDIGYGTSGKFHGLLHSGARYAVTDPDSARECIQENKIISKIAPHTVKDTGGVFLGITDDDLQFSETFIKALNKVGIESKVIDVKEVLQKEPFINRDTKMAIWVPDKVVYGYDLLASVAITASLNGAKILTYNEVVEIIRENNNVKGVKVLDKINNNTNVIKSDIIVNTAGPWSFNIIKMAGLEEIPIMPTAGIIVVFDKRVNNMVINRLRPPSDGDIIVPYADSSILGTTATIIEDPDNFTISDEDIAMLVNEGAYLIPKLKNMRVVRSYASVRPLIKSEVSAREASRDFRIIDHEKENGLSGLVSVIGGKFTTGRLAGERVADLVSSKLGIKSASKTATTKLLSPNDINLLNYAEKIRLPKVIVRSILDRKGSLDEERYLSSLYILLSLISRGTM
ncbi:FAD-dependent oxidoreductase [Saccharolobus solfataricus]|nr:FAD-dependent oxidoreductase [Saccharolobus solfataricus]AKA72752.1 FAD-dependent oxidoreductase [Saccharolobus solfataricus]AKA75451.1 FAD-dependent oxidoreductase [Saccharolobus solfataricus]AKA78144.1 FAD-dependent oxidoreductase [Saccharolobus solfataricus]AZF67263.1 FAD-dependent oxidoreductase [Saccharolobus solfataricus]AZF69883.1 FAD-dependent oxidoreductase [Saccharolobus solfataricus]